MSLLLLSSPHYTSSSNRLQSAVSHPKSLPVNGRTLSAPNTTAPPLGPAIGTTIIAC